MGQPNASLDLAMKVRLGKPYAEQHRGGAGGQSSSQRNSLDPYRGDLTCLC